MDDPLQKLKRELRSEKCPAEVLARVRERIARERRRRDPRVAWAAFAGGAALLVAVAMLMRPWNGEQPPGLPAPEKGIAAMNSARVAEEATLSLACIGQVLLEAGTHSQEVVLKAALPPLRQSLITLQTTLKKPKTL